MLISFLMVCCFILVELFKLQILGFDSYQKKVIEQMTVETNVSPNRGEILDRNGNVLATNITVWILYLLPRNIVDPKLISNEIAKILNVDTEKIYKKATDKSYKYQIVSNNVNKENSDKILNFIEKHNLENQIMLKASTSRSYPFSDLASHTIGFVNGDGKGIYGLERTYNNLLDGENGKYITAQNAQSGEMPFQYEEYIDNEKSYNVISTIDLYIQYQLEAQIKAAAIEAGAENRACGIVMNPKNGEIYGMAVYPSFDLNNPYTLDEASSEKLSAYEKGTSEYRNQYLNMLFSMWNNKAVSELYEPGSTFKLVTTSVALQEKAASLKDVFNCTGALKIDGFYRAISCHKKTGHGQLSFSEALQQSCNPSMMKMAFSIGREMFYKYFQKFGYTSRTGIDLPSEAMGYFHNYDNFSNVSLAVYSFGQTFKTTAIQQLRAVSAVANGGYLVTPHFLKQIVDDNGEVIYETSLEKSEQIINEDVSNTISEILRDGVDGNGGAKNAYVAGYSVAAKTGTSEKKDKFDANGQTSYRVSSCVAYAPTEDAQVAVIIIVDEPSIGSKYGSVVAAPYVSSLLDLILPYIGIKAEYGEMDEKHREISVDNYINLEACEAENRLKSENLKYEIVGNGRYVLSQTPSSGSVIYKNGGKVILYTENNFEQSRKVPNVIGITVESANDILVNSGFNVKIEGPYNYKIGQKAFVVYQSHTAEEYLKKGSIITIKILYMDEE